MSNLLLGSAVILGAALLFSMIRVMVGPTTGDRMIAITVISTKTVTLLAIIALFMHEGYFLDVALVYCIISLTANFFIAREFYEGGCSR